MSDLISRQAAIEAIDSYEVDAPDYMQGWAVKLIEAIKEDIRGLISELPSAQLERKVGKWIEINNGLDTTCECSACHYKDYILNDKDYKCYDRYWFHRNYCPNCGAKVGMGGDAE